MNRAPIGVGMPGVALLLTVGCAAAAPVVGGGRTAPVGRAEVGAGGATRIALGGLAAGDDPVREAARRAAWTGGTAPVITVRGGLGDGWDVGAVIAGSTARLDVRRELVLQEGLTRVVAIVGGGLLAGLAVDGDGLEGETGARWGAEVPLLVAADVTGLGELWGGVRLRIETVDIRATAPQPPPGGPAPAPTDLDARAVQTDVVVGYGWGFRNLHVLLELAVGHGWWTSAIANARGVVLTPAFVMRFRL